jgi:hypothetical protein
VLLDWFGLIYRFKGGFLECQAKRADSGGGLKGGLLQKGLK